MSETKKLSVIEVADSVTGYEEREVLEQFDRPLGDLQFTNSAAWARALVYVLKRREGTNEIDALDAALKLAFKDVWSVFDTESAESGKDEPDSVQLPESSPLSAS